MKKDYLERQSYPTDLTDDQWAIIEPLLNNSRRLSKDYEPLTSSSESMIKISHIHTLLKRL